MRCSDCVVNADVHRDRRPNYSLQVSKCSRSNRGSSTVTEYGELESKRVLPVLSRAEIGLSGGTDASQGVDSDGGNQCCLNRKSAGSRVEGNPRWLTDRKTSLCERGGERLSEIAGGRLSERECGCDQRSGAQDVNLVRNRARNLNRG